ncbi:MAG: hypothetical protein J6A01_09055 [Proteobacteria bacterium]|nr:hypothetical protein [Pseudomonadota bacterium]
MQIQCPKCKQWTESDTGVCSACNASLYDDDTSNQNADGHIQKKDIICEDAQVIAHQRRIRHIKAIAGASVGGLLLLSAILAMVLDSETFFVIAFLLLIIEFMIFGKSKSAIDN